MAKHNVRKMMNGTLHDTCPACRGTIIMKHDIVYGEVFRSACPACGAFFIIQLNSCRNGETVSLRGLLASEWLDLRRDEPEVYAMWLWSASF